LNVRSLTPPTSFEYEDGYPAFGLASMTKVHGGPPNAVEDDRVLPFIGSVGLVDFNRDGLPDIVQGWKPNLGCSTISCDEARPMIGYLNRCAGLYVELEHQCFDAGRIDDTTGLSHYGQSSLDGFFTNRGGTTLVGPWGEGVLAWSNAQYAPYRARPLLPQFDLVLLTLSDVAGIPTTGQNVVIVARIGSAKYVRIFDAAGSKIYDRLAIEDIPDQTLGRIDDAFAAPPTTETKRAITDQIMSATDYGRPFESGSGCDVDNFSIANFKPAWEWEKTRAPLTGLNHLSPSGRRGVRAVGLVRSGTCRAGSSTSMGTGSSTGLSPQGSRPSTSRQRMLNSPSATPRGCAVWRRDRSGADPLRLRPRPVAA
jgi:hypothetical protein